jgi:hypothetical protein
MTAEYFDQRREVRADLGYLARSLDPGPFHGVVLLHHTRLLTTSRIKLMGASSGKTIFRKHRVAPAPSIAAASTNVFGIACSPAKKNKKL